MLFVSIFVSKPVSAEEIRAEDRYTNKVTVRFVPQKTSELPKTSELSSQTLEKIGLALISLVAIGWLNKVSKSTNEE